MIAVNEIFYSIQGEGDYAGSPMVFVRVAGCNLACSWCDQPDTIHEGFEDRQGVSWTLKYKKMPEEDIISQVMKYPTKRVCLTGGEPTAHKLDTLIGWLHTAKKLVHLETNGTYYTEWMEWVDHMVCSPKREHKPVAKSVKMAKELKFIVDEKFDIKEVEEYKHNFMGQIYLQPCGFQNTWNPDMLKKTMELVHRYPQYKLSVQLHKILGVR